MADQPLISLVIVTAPGRQRDLWRCLRSILNSDCRNWETVVVDNSGEPNFDQKITKAFPDKRIKVIKMPFNSGLLGFNVGIVNTKGKYIMIIDDDSAVYRETLAKVIKLFDRLPQSVGVVSAAVYDRVLKRYTDNSGIDLSKTFRSFSGSGIFKREVFATVGYFEDKFFCWNFEEDFTIRFLQAGWQQYFASKKELLVDHYYKSHHFRKEQVFLITRNKVWLNVKHFSWLIMPVIFIRDMIWILLQPFRRKNWRALVYAAAGYLTGILTAPGFIKNRHVAPWWIQKQYLQAQVGEDFKRLVLRKA